MALNPQQQAFVRLYAGNATDAARKAGYTGTARSLEVTGSRLLRHTEVRAALRARQAEELSPHIMDRAARQRLWTSIALDPKQKATDRLKASELLGRSEADFTEKVLVQGKLTLEQLVEQAAGGAQKK